MNRSNPQLSHTPVAIIGGGPIGIEMAIALEQVGQPYTLFEARQIGNFISTWPPNTHFFSTPEHVALGGVPFHTLDQATPTGEQYLAYLRMLVEMYGLNIRLYEPVTKLQPQQQGFQLETETRNGTRLTQADRVILATGGMDHPRYLGIPGEDLPHVTHHFPGPHPYFRTRVLVVGGKNSALETALRLWRGGAEVTLSYRRGELNFERVKPHLSMDMGDRLRKEEIAFLGGTIPVRITPTFVELARTDNNTAANGSTFRLETDFVILATGFEADMSLFEAAGVSLLGEEQSPAHNPDTMETNVPYLYVAGTAVGGTQLKRFTHFISTSHDHVIKIAQAITGRRPSQVGTVDARNNAVTYQEVKAN